ncbi:MAG: adenine phosphoribosyltransferase [Myxococcota bacterium]
MTPAELLAKKIRDVPDFPEPGVVFKDITPLLQDPESLELACELLAGPYREHRVELVVGIESRGFIFGPAVARQLRAGFVPARKLGKLPWETVSERYDLEYGSNEIEMHRDAIAPEQRVLLIDDLIATGGTAAATVKLIRRMGGDVVGSCFLIELSFLEGRKALHGIEVESILTY